MTPTETSKAVQTGLHLHRANQLAEAERVYLGVLAIDANHADALHLLGTLYGQTGRKAEGLRLIARACAAHPTFAPYQLNLGNALKENGRLGEAIEAYRTAIKLDPASDKAHSNLGIALREAGQLNESIASMRRAIEINPLSSIAYDNLGIALLENGETQASIAAHGRALELDPQSAIALSNISISLRVAGRLDEAIAACHRSLALRPNNADAYNNLGVALADKGETHAAIAAYEKALALNPKLTGVHTNLGISRGELGDIAGALAHCQQAVTEDPANARAHFNFGIALLQVGVFDRGWDEYEWRWKCREHAPPIPFREPRWDGGRLDGRTLFIHAEQGLGDAIQFVRYLPMVAALGGRVILGCAPSLRRLFQNVAGLDQIVVSGETVPRFDVHCPIVSLAHAFKTNANTIPAHVPYLVAREPSVQDWRQSIAAAEETLAKTPGALRVGLVWAGASKHGNDRNRSIRLHRLAPLASPDVIFYSLQKGPPASEADDPPAGMRLIDLSENLFDFADTAGLIANLDLVISVDTAVAHLAGAMGKPVWTLLPFHPDWRWLLDREDSPWYPTMRLFRQREIGGWDEMIDRVARELRTFA